jgi:ankyrin repeat protein
MGCSEVWQGILDASRDGDIARVQQMLENGAPINSQDIFDGYTPLHYAIGSGNTELVRFLIHRGADIEHNDNTVHQTPLATAVLASQIEIVELLLDVGANVSATLYPDGQSLVDAALQEGNDSIAELLRRHK